MFLNNQQFFETYRDAAGNFLFGIRGDGCIQFQDGTFLGTAIAEHGFQIMPADGTVTIAGGSVLITKPGQAHITVNAPVPGLDPLGADGNILRFISSTNFAHVLNFPTGGIIGPSGAKSTCTMVPGGAALSAHFLAYQGLWYVDSVSNASLT